MRICSSCFWKFFYASFVGGIKSEGGGGFGEGIDSGGTDMTFSIVTKVAMRVFYIRGKITKYPLAQYV